MYQNQPPQPYPNPYGTQTPPPVRRRQWWQHPALVITALVVLPPAGIALAWLSPWGQTKKIVATVLSGIWFLVAFLGDPPAEEQGDAKPKTAASASATASASSSPTPSPSADLLMPDVVGKTFSEAEASVEALIDGELRAASAYGDVSLPTNHATWIVCFQGPAAGTRLVPAGADPNVHLVAPGTACPATTGTELRPEPSKSPTPTAKPKPKRTTPAPTPTPTPTRDDSGDSGGGSSVYYKNCDAVRAADADPIRVGDPGYGSHLDRDGDGVGCE
ncbi:excalibur calcium-binding domain-containing protein [Streptomyces sp. P9(2023)]|uniref:excalibur calcium-binding domain-containing protein n=1 Tax=Streptomyces sp. P9(2023) TaxID=3064394 RepID=UPI0028F43743|nr:excalibur calcium-binding domain-containing protein [Streptomyces sp. P9(2023)]MDT9688051.1 excalibur calcium-binding domain-containing protein [Streptomyces sp. P9(2023)]